MKFSESPITTTLRTQRMRFAVVLWLILGMSAAFASPFLRPARYEVVCGASGKAHLVTHDDGSFGSKSRPKNFHDMDCALCAATSLPRLALDAPSLQPIDGLLNFALPTLVQAVPPTAAPPPARAPPFNVSLFFQQSSERSI